MNFKIYFGIVITVLSYQNVEICAQRINCRTTQDSTDPLKPCVFPFIFQGSDGFGYHFPGSGRVPKK